MTDSGIALISIIPVRENPAESAEMGTQLLFGQCYQVHEEQDKWIKISISDDGYEGWIDKKLFVHCKDEQNMFCLSQVYSIKEEGVEYPITLMPGSYLPCTLLEEKQFLLGGKTWISDIYKESTPIMPDAILPLALSYLNAPYLWGGKSLFGIDCSGFSQVVYAALGIKIPRNASEQIHKGKEVSFVEEAQVGDLAFFDNEEGNITHVGILTGKGEIIHASGWVRRDKLDHQGIFNRETGKYTHKLRVIKRVL